MRDELLAYLLNDLDPEQCSRIEARLESDPIWQHELRRLRSYVDEARETSSSEAGPGESGADKSGAGKSGAGKSGVGEADALPVDLVSRTCSFVKQASAQGALSPAVLPASLTESQDAIAPASKRWSLIDLTIVASILLVLGTLALPALRESRDAARRAQCQANLRQLGTALVNYAERFNGELPRVEPHENVGIFIVRLVEGGMLTRERASELIVCPDSKLAEDVFAGTVKLDVPTREQLATAIGSKLKLRLKLMRERMSGDYAFGVGYRDQAGNYQYRRFVGSGNLPLLADAPSFDSVGFQSVNHKEGGQNVLSQDLSVRYVVNACQEDHLYLNAAGKHAAGNDRNDTVMLLSGFSPNGPFPKLGESK